MKKLLVMDEKNYTSDMPEFEKFSVRGIVERNGKIATQCGNAGDYKILGGGIDAGESKEEALAREILEEAGLFLLPETMELLGEAEEIRRDCFKPHMTYHCHSIFYRCQVSEEETEPRMTPSEIEKGYHLVWASPEEIVEACKKFPDRPWICRDAEIIRLLYMA